MPSGARWEATAADDPPEEPPGTRSKSHGLRLGPNAEFSVAEPIAHSSRLVLPRITTPAARSRLTTVESYGGRQPWRILDPQLVGTFRWVNTSLSASGTPASGPSGSPAARAASTARAAAMAPSVSMYR